MHVQLPTGQPRPTDMKKAPANTFKSGSVEKQIENMKQDENFVDPCKPTPFQTTDQAQVKKNVASLMK